MSWGFVIRETAADLIALKMLILTAAEPTVAGRREKQFGNSAEQTTLQRCGSNIFVRFLKFFVPLTKRQEISDFWCPENHAEVTKRMMAGKYASFEPLSANC